MQTEEMCDSHIGIQEGIDSSVRKSSPIGVTGLEDCMITLKLKGAIDIGA